MTKPGGTPKQIINSDFAVTIITLSMGLSDKLILTLRSVENQSRTVRHILIDGSQKTDIKKYCDVKFSAVEVYSQEPQGIYSAMNFGLNLVEDFSYVMFLNEADFLLGPDAIAKLTSSLSSLDSWVYGGTLAFSEYDEKTFEYGYKLPNWKNFKLGLELVPHPSTLIPAYWLKNLKGFKKFFRIAADTEMIFRIYRKYGPAKHNQELISAHEIGGISSVLKTRSNFESRLARIMNFPLVTLKKIFITMLTRKMSKISANNLEKKANSRQYKHFGNCRRKERIPLCCKRALMELA
jgi:glycosyltransferase involved in cell wall biosynthesis